MEQLYYFCLAAAFWMNGVIYVNTHERRENFIRRLLLCTVLFLLCYFIAGRFFFGTNDVFRMIGRLIGVGLLIFFQYTCWNITWSVAVYGSIWAVMSWQLIYGLWIGISGQYPEIYSDMSVKKFTSVLLFFAVWQLIEGYTIARWMPEGEPRRIGPRQMASAVLIFCTFEIIGLAADNIIHSFQKIEWQVLYLSQLLLAVILYLQNELFKKSIMRQELAVMNLLWKKGQEQYLLSKENIALINHKCHDLKHQIRAIRNASKEDIDRYLADMENSIQIYESIVKTGNEVLDTILTEKSLYCREHQITISCVADGSQMEFINTVDLYAILGNALDNAIEAVEKFKKEEMRQIDVLIHRQQQFLVIQIINPLEGSLMYEEELPVTTKGDKQYHGFGLKSMRYLVKKYGGFLSVSTVDDCFSLKILIPIPTVLGTK